MSPSSFSLFANFPIEVQRLIWDAAVRPLGNRPQVQYFIITQQNLNIKGDFLRLGKEGYERSAFKLAVPHTDALGGDGSGYLTDSGLWTACQESRAAMDRRYKENEWWSEMPGSSPLSCHGKPGDYFRHRAASNTASYLPGGDGYSSTDATHIRHITFQPGNDLFFFTPLKLAQVDWWHHYAYDGVPLVDGDRQSSLGRCFLGQNVAVAYEPMAMWMLGGHSIHMCRHTSRGISPVALGDFITMFHDYVGWTIWFVDYRLRRRQQRGMEKWNPDSVQKKRMSLPRTVREHKADKVSTCQRQEFLSQNCVYTEVKRQDVEAWVIEGEDQSSVFDMFDLLVSQGNGRPDIAESDRIGVLVCEMRTGKPLLDPWPMPAANAPCSECAAAKEAKSAATNAAIQTRLARRREIGSLSEDYNDIDPESLELFD